MKIPTYDEFVFGVNYTDISQMSHDDVLKQNKIYLDYLINIYSSNPDKIYELVSENFQPQKFGGPERRLEHSLFTQKNWWGFNDDLLVLLRSDGSFTRLFSKNKEFTRQASGEYISYEIPDFESIIVDLSELFPKIPVIDLEHSIIERNELEFSLNKLQLYLQGKKIDCMTHFDGVPIDDIPF